MHDLDGRLERIRAALADRPELLEDLAVLTARVRDPALVWLDADGATKRCTEPAQRLWGVEPGRPLWEAFAQDAAAVRALVQRGWVGLGERTFRGADGRHALFRPVSLEHGVIEVCDTTRMAALAAEAAQQAQHEALTGFAAAVAAELANPASVVEGRLELALAVAREDDPVSKQIGAALTQAREISGAVRALRLVGHQALTTAARTAVDEVVAAAWEAAAPRLRGAELELSAEPGLVVGADPTPLTRALSHLLVVLADEPKRTLWVEAEATDDGVVLAMSRECALNAADPLAGSSFAQAVAAALIGGLGGEVRSHHDSERVTLEIRLPPPSGQRVRARRGSEAVLVVGRPALTDVLAPILEPEGFVLEWAANGEEALTRLAEEHFAGVVADLLLDHCSGLAVATAQTRNGGPPCAVIASAPIAGLPEGVTVLVPPLARRSLLRALGRRVRGG